MQNFIIDWGTLEGVVLKSIKIYENWLFIDIVETLDRVEKIRCSRVIGGIEDED